MAEPSNKNPAALRKHRAGGSTSGLLASLFNVAASRPAQIHHEDILVIPLRFGRQRHASSFNVFFAFGRGGG
jgi:hypothetical protein